MQVQLVPDVLGTPIAIILELAIHYIHVLITTRQPVVITSIYNRSLCIQPQV